MGDFHKAFEAIDEDGSGEITVNELQHYMMKNNYKHTFVTKWLKLFDVDNSGTITYKHYCETLGLVPKDRGSISSHAIVIEDKEDTLTMEVENKEHMEVDILIDSTPQMISVVKENNDIIMKETSHDIPKNRKSKSNKICDNTLKVTEIVGNYDVKMEKAIEKNHSNILNSEVNQNNIKEITIIRGKDSEVKQVQISEANIDDVIMEKTIEKNQSKKVASGKQKDNVSQSVKNSAPKVLKASDTKKDEAIITKSTESNVAVSDTTNVKRIPRNPKSYPIQVKKKAPRHRMNIFSKHKRHLRSSIEPGVILILLSGTHKGKRVVFLKQLSSGLLLVTGPFKINGCPLRRVHQQMVIATKTRIDISQVNIPEHVNDGYFGRESNKKQESTDVSTIFAKTKKEYVLREERKRDQKDVDKLLFEAIKVRDDKKTMIKYLKSMFSLSSHDCPHLMKF